MLSIQHSIPNTHHFILNTMEELKKQKETQRSIRKLLCSSYTSYVHIMRDKLNLIKSNRNKGMEEVGNKDRILCIC